MEPISYRISEDEYLAFWKLATRKAFRVTMMVLGGYLLLVIAISRLAEASEVLFWIAVVVVAIMAFAIVQRAIGAPRFVRATYREDAGIKEPVTLTFDSDGFSRSFPSGTLSSRWNDMVKWHENDEIFAVFPNRQLGHVFPKAKVGHEAIDAIRGHLIESGLPIKNRLRK